MSTTYDNLLTTATPREGVDFIAIYGVTTYNQISGALANGQMVFVKVTYDTDKYRYAPLTDQTAIDGETNYYTFTCTINNIIYTYKVSELNTWTTTTKNVTDNTLPVAPDTTNNYELTCKAGNIAWTNLIENEVFIAILGTTTLEELQTAYNAGKFLIARTGSNGVYDYWYLVHYETYGGGIFTFSGTEELNKLVYAHRLLQWNLNNTTGILREQSNTIRLQISNNNLVCFSSKDKFKGIDVQTAFIYVWESHSPTYVISGKFLGRKTVSDASLDPDIQYVLYFELNDPGISNISGGLSGTYTLTWYLNDNYATVEKVSN